MGRVLPTLPQTVGEGWDEGLLPLPQTVGEGWSEGLLPLPQQWERVGVRAASRRTRLNLLELATQPALLFHQVKIHLQTQKHPFGHPEIAGQPQVRVGRHGALAEHDFIDAPGRHLDGTGESVLAQAKGFQEFFQQNLAGVRLVNVSGTPSPGSPTVGSAGQ
jgi:hypothetical protein